MTESQQPSQADRIRPYQWKPGQSGNPNGRPKGESLTAKLRRVLETEHNGRAIADLIAERIVKEALSGKFPFAKELLDRLDGLATSPHQRARAAGHRAWYLTTLADWDGAIEAGRRALACCDEVDDAELCASISQRLGTALAMAWVITQSGVAQQLAVFMKTLPGGVFGFMAVTIVMFLILGCVLEGLPALLLMAPLMFPIARTMGVNDVHYAMVVVVAMNIGLMMPPIGVGFYIACRIGDVSPDEAMGAIWPYIAALIVGLVVIAAVPGISTAVL